MKSLEHKRIAIDARPLSMSHTGVALYLKSVIRALRAEGAEVTLISNAPLVSKDELLKSCKFILARGSNRFIWEQFSLLAVLARENFDVYFCGWNYGLPLLYFGKTKLILSVLDLIPLNYPEIYLRKRKDRWVYKASLKIGIEKAAKLITISQSSADDFSNHYPTKKIESIYIKMLPVAPPAKTPYAGDYFCYLGGVDHRKNIDKLIIGFSKYCSLNPAMKLVLIGKGFDQFSSLIDELEIKDKVILTGYVSDEDKYSILQGSRALVYPSRAEGFGLPIVEAILVGTPTITGDSQALKEIGQEAALYVDPQSTDEICGAMKELDSPEVQAMLRRACAARADYFCDSALDKKMAASFAETLN